MNNYQRKTNKIAKWIYLYNLSHKKKISFYKARKWIRRAGKKRNIIYY